MLNRRRAYSMRASRAFTLVELLMTIGVIGILAAMLLTVVGRVKSRVQAVCCLNNLQQWGNATHLYALDNDGFLPPDGWANPHSTPNRKMRRTAGTFCFPKPSGCRRILKCPGVPIQQSIWDIPSGFVPATPGAAMGPNFFHYCLNECVNGTGANQHRVRLEDLPRPSQHCSSV